MVPGSARNRIAKPTKNQPMKTSIKNLIVALALLMGWLCTSSTLYAFPALTIPHPDQLAQGTIFTTNGLGAPLNPPVSYVTPATLLATGGVPLSRYTWTISTG